MGNYDQDQAVSANIVFLYCGDWRLSGRSGVVLAELVEELAKKLGLDNGHFDGMRSPGGAFILENDMSDDQSIYTNAVAVHDSEKYKVAMSRGEYFIPSLHMDCGCIGPRERDYYVLLLWQKTVIAQRKLYMQRVPGAILINNNEHTTMGGEVFTHHELYVEVLGIIKKSPALSKELQLTESEVTKDNRFLTTSHRLIESRGSRDPNNPHSPWPMVKGGIQTRAR